MESDAARLIHPRNGALRLEVEMLLPADAEFPGNAGGFAAGPGAGLAPLQPKRPRVKAAGG